MASTRRLSSGKWQATVYHPSGKRYTRTHSLKRVVTEWAAETEAKIRTGAFTEPELGRMTLEQWWARWWAQRRAEVATKARNESQWRNHVKPAFGSWPLASLTSWEIEGWVSGMVAAQVGPETVASSLRLLRYLLAEAVRHRLIGVNPAELVSAPTPPKHVDRYVSREEADRIIGALDGADALFVSLLFETGLRWSEAAALRGRNVDLMREQLTVEKSLRRDGTDKDPKTGAGTRQVPLTTDLVRDLSVHLAGRDRDGYVFTTAEGTPLAYTNWRRRVWVPAVERAGIDKPWPTAHDARHAYGSWLGAAGMGQADIARLMGHGSTRSTERYVHATPARMGRAREALERSKIVSDRERTTHGG